DERRAGRDRLPAGVSDGEESGGIERRFGPYGGQFVPETLMRALAELERAWSEARVDEGFRSQLERLLADFGGRPTPLYLANRLSERDGSRGYLEREALHHTRS